MEDFDIVDVLRLVMYCLMVEDFLVVSGDFVFDVFIGVVVVVY